MKIIKQGKISADKVYKTDCTKCKAIFEFTMAEARLVSDMRDGDYMEVICPCCSKKIAHAI